MAVGDPCDVCGNPIPRGSGGRKRCSDACRREARKRYERALYRQDPDKFIATVERYRARHPERVVATLGRRRKKDYRANRVALLHTHYRLTLDQYDAMAEAQDGRCAICRRFETRQIRGRPVPLSVDHDHATGVVRGLLCGRCNSVLGFFDDAELFAAATDYLRRHDIAKEATN